MLEMLSDPTIWIGLLTLVILEIVLGIDNLIFIAILSEKLPPHQRDKARVMGLCLALFMRLGLLAAISWLANLTTPLFKLGPASFSGRDLILLLGGLFLLFKATTELHERLEGFHQSGKKNTAYGSFVAVVAQIVILDAVFSLDSVITAVGMVNELSVMMAAVVISIGVMLLASKPLTRFVNAHPTVVILCLSFLLMIGFSLVAEGLGFQFPKGYLYAAIGFSILTEAFNQFSTRNALKNELRIPLRERTANKVLALLGTSLGSNVQPDDPEHATSESGFDPLERNMVSGVLTLGERKIRSIMTPVSEVDWVDLNDDQAAIQASLHDNPHSALPVCRGEIDAIVGVARAKDMLRDFMQHGRIQDSSIKPPRFAHEGSGVLTLVTELRASQGRMVIVKNEFNAISGVVTPVDLLEAIAGEFPDEDEGFTIEQLDREGLSWQASGTADVHHIEQLLGIQHLASENDSYTTLAGALMQRPGVVLAVKHPIDIEDWRFEITDMHDGVIRSVHIYRTPPESPPED